jgi:hypothetical protein
LLAAGPLTKDEINNHLSPKQKQEIKGALESLEAAGLVSKAVKSERVGIPAAGPATCRTKRKPISLSLQTPSLSSCFCTFA